MSRSVKLLGYLMAANTQAIALILTALWVGKYLNATYPQGFDWYWVTFGVGLTATVQTFYVLVRAAFRLDRDALAEDRKREGGDGRSRR